MQILFIQKQKTNNVTWRFHKTEYPPSGAIILMNMPVE